MADKNRTKTGRTAQVSDSMIGWLSFATQFVVGTDTFLVAPLLPELRQQFGIGVEASGWLVSSYALGYALCALVTGPLSDRTDRRRMLLAGLAAFSLLTASCGLAQGFWSMATLRFLTGVAAALATPQIWASIPQLVAPNQVVKTMGRATVGLAIAQLAGIPLGALLASASWRFSFFAIGAVATLVTLLLALYFPHVDASRAGNSGTRGYRAVLASQPLIISLIAYFIFQTGNFAALSFFGSWFSRDFHLTTSGIGSAMIAIGAGNAVGSLFGYRLVAKWGTPRSLVIGILAMAAGYAGVAFTQSLIPAICLLTFVMLAAGFLFPVLMTTLQSNAGTNRGTVSSLTNVAMYAGPTIGAGIAGPLFNATPQFTGIAALTITGYLIALLLFTRVSR